MNVTRFTCKHCGRYFSIDWDAVYLKRTGTVYRGMFSSRKKEKTEPEPEFLDLICPHCKRKAEYCKSEGREMNPHEK